MPAGFNVSAGIVREDASPWPGVAGVLVRLLNLLSESVRRVYRHTGVVTVDSAGFTANPLIEQVGVTGDLSVAMHYVGLETLVGCALGFMNPQYPIPIGGGLYQHLFEIDPVLSQVPWAADEGWIADDNIAADQQKVRRFTYTVDRNGVTWQTTSAMVAGFTFQTNGAGTTGTFSITGESQVIFTGGFDPLPIPKSPILFRQAVLYIRESGPLVEIGDLVGFSLTVQNNFGSLSTVNTGTFFDEPSRVGPVVVSGTFALPLYTQSVLPDWLFSGAQLSALLEFVGDIPGDTLRFWLPSIQLTSFESSVTGPTQLQQNFSFVAASPINPLEDFPDNIKNGPLLIELVNTHSGHFLLE